MSPAEKRLKELLLRREEKLSFMLRLLDLQSAAIRAGDSEKLAAYAEMIRGAGRELEMLQKVCLPLESICRKSYPSGGAGGCSELDGLRAAVERLSRASGALIAENRTLLSREMTRVRDELDSLRIPRGPLFTAGETGRFFDISQ